MTQLKWNLSVVGKEKKGLTLLEMILVIALLAILVGLLLPVLGRVQESRRRTVCVSQLHQIGLALTIFAQDHRGQLPVWGDTGLYAVVRPVGLGELYPDYVPNRLLFFCPGASHTFPNDPYHGLPQWGRRRGMVFGSYYYRPINKEYAELAYYTRRALVCDEVKSEPGHSGPVDPQRMYEHNTNHRNQIVQAVYGDGHVATFPNPCPRNSPFGWSSIDLFIWLDQQMTVGAK